MSSRALIPLSGRCWFYRGFNILRRHKKWFVVDFDAVKYPARSLKNGMGEIDYWYRLGTVT